MIKDFIDKNLTPQFGNYQNAIIYRKKNLYEISRKLNY